jgi:hypothetical protein
MIFVLLLKKGEYTKRVELYNKSMFIDRRVPYLKVQMCFLLFEVSFLHEKATKCND